MKKLLAFLIVSALVFTLAACGGAGKDNVTDPPADDTASVPTQTDDADVTGDEEQNDDAAAEELKNQLIGEWGFPGDETDIEHLTFGADGTGTYRSVITDKNYTFNYVVYIDHREYNNGEPYTESMLRMEYDNGETEDIIFFFTESGKLAFHNADNGGYIGAIDFTDAFTKE